MDKTGPRYAVYRLGPEAPESWEHLDGLWVDLSRLPVAYPWTEPEPGDQHVIAKATDRRELREDGAMAVVYDIGGDSRTRSHPFQQAVARVRVCWCGKWPHHHIHGSDELCWCDEHKAARINDLHTQQLTVQGYYEGGPLDGTAT